ncbi:MAG: Gfo/Idh/MocA family oxidoreductase [Verrucomicrobiales bacterium]|jgi:predicted dehydrogenase|nr:Gfo/Idh/MocA family oxidoreductase [Verrucomicrobiales bacterium]
MSKHRFNRREFLTLGAGALAASAWPNWLRAAEPAAAAPPKLRIANIGVGGMGMVDLRGVSGENIVALCDVDATRARAAFNLFPDAARYRDYRQMFNEMADQIDAVVISTPDHTHFPAAMRALEAGKHIYVQKPLTHTIGEARLLREAARKAGVVTQMGNQGHANEGTRYVREWIEAGAIGTVREIHAWTNRPIWPQGVDWPAEKTVPATLDWNLWLGTAPWDEYRERSVPFDWRGYSRYGCGALGDMGCHLLDAAFWTLNLRGNCRVTPTTEGATEVSGPKGATVVYEFPARGDLPPVKLHWYEGSHFKHVPRPPELEADKELSPGGSAYYRGDKGVLFVNGSYSDSPRLIPETAMKEFKRPEKTIPRIRGGAYREWLDACKGLGPAPGSNIVDHSAEMTELCLIGQLAMQLNKPIDWDAANARCVGLPEADALIYPEYRIF